jgi:hypothetical protein
MNLTKDKKTSKAASDAKVKKSAKKSHLQTLKSGD